MKSAFLRKVVGMIVGLALLSACAGNGGGVPARDGVPQAAGWPGNSDAAILNLSGQYKGTVSTGRVSNVKSALDVGQYRAAIGGRLTLHFGTPPIVGRRRLDAQRKQTRRNDRDHRRSMHLRNDGDVRFDEARVEWKVQPRARVLREHERHVLTEASVRL